MHDRPCLLINLPVAYRDGIHRMPIWAGLIVQEAGSRKANTPRTSKHLGIRISASHEMRMHVRRCVLATRVGHLLIRHPSNADASEVDRLEAGPRCRYAEDRKASGRN